jgi:hypothetical protein
LFNEFYAPLKKSLEDVPLPRLPPLPPLPLQLVLLPPPSLPLLLRLLMGGSCNTAGANAPGRRLKDANPKPET